MPGMFMAQQERSQHEDLSFYQVDFLPFTIECNQKIVKKVLIAFMSISFLTQCTSREKQIQGTWKTDSILNFVNGFSHTNNSQDEHWSNFEYNNKNEVFERRKAEFRKYSYKIVSADSLVYLDSAGTILNGYQILKLDNNQLILKKDQKPYLPGKNQKLYEIRFFSRTSPDSTSALK